MTNRWDHCPVRARVHSLSPEPSTPRCDDGRARRDHFSHDGKRESYVAREATRAFSGRIDQCQV